MNAAKNERHAMLGTLWFAIANYALRIWPWIIVALVSAIMFPILKGGDLKLGYPLVLNAVLPIGLKGLMVTSILAAFMSTIDTHLNWASSYFINDII